MKRLAIQFTWVLLAMVLVSVGCKKYEDGPGLSLRSKRERIINTWKAEVALMDDVDATAWFSDWELDIREDGRIVITDLDDRDSVVTQNGFWDFVNEQQEVRFLYTVPAVAADRKTVTILRLKDKEFWYRDATDSVVWEMHLIPSDTTN
jgi:hypothetical protein